MVQCGTRLDYCLPPLLVAGSSTAKERSSFAKILCAVCNYIPVVMNSIGSKMSAGFESCDPFTVTGMFRIPVALVHVLKATLHPPVLRTSKAPAPSDQEKMFLGRLCLHLPLKHLALVSGVGRWIDSWGGAKARRLLVTECDLLPLWSRNPLQNLLKCQPQTG